MLPPALQVLPHSSARGAIRHELRSGSSAGRWSANCRARCQLVRAALDVTVGEPRPGPHVPAESFAKVSCRLEMRRDHRRVLICQRPPCRATFVLTGPD